MKITHDTRHKKREHIVKDLFTWQLNPTHKIVSADTKQIIDNLGTIDNLIQEAATSRPLAEINKIDLAILRLAVFELTIQNTQISDNQSGKTTPYKVIIDEAVELAKEYGSESSSSLVNGALGSIVASAGIEPKTRKEE